MITAEEKLQLQKLAIRRFVQFVEDNACVVRNESLSELLQAEQDFITNELPTE